MENDIRLATGEEVDTVRNRVSVLENTPIGTEKLEDNSITPQKLNQSILPIFKGTTQDGASSASFKVTIPEVSEAYLGFNVVVVMHKSYGGAGDKDLWFSINGIGGKLLKRSTSTGGYVNGAYYKDNVYRFICTGNYWVCVDFTKPVWSDIYEKPTTLLGYGITDAATKQYVQTLETRITALEQKLLAQ